MRTLQDVKNASVAVGNHFFSPGAMRFFNARNCETLTRSDREGAVWFITSERLSWDSPRLYSIRKATLHYVPVPYVDRYDHFRKWSWPHSLETEDRDLDAEASGEDIVYGWQFDIETVEHQAYSDRRQAYRAMCALMPL